MNKREFIKSVTLLGLGVSAGGSLIRSSPFAPGRTDSAADDSKDFWEKIRGTYAPDADRINLENGYYCVMPTPTLEASLIHTRKQNQLGSYYLRTRQADDKVAVRAM